MTTAQLHRRAESAGAEVVYRDGLPAGGRQISGALLLAEGRTIIALNSSRPEALQRYSLAQHLGHLTLRHRLAYLPGQTMACGCCGHAMAHPKAERAANLWAAELLAPAESLPETVDSSDEDLTRKLARQRGISVPIMTWWLATLGRFA